MDNILDIKEEQKVIPQGPKSPCFRNAYSGVDSSELSKKAKFNFDDDEEDQNEVKVPIPEPEIKLDIAL